MLSVIEGYSTHDPRCSRTVSGDFGQADRVDGDIPTLRLEPFQHARRGIDHGDRYPCLPREGVEKRLNQKFLSVGAEVNLIGALWRRAGNGGKRNDKRDQRGGGEKLISHVGFNFLPQVRLRRIIINYPQ